VNVTSNEYKNRHYPHVNITMPVFNRHDLTVASILSVNKHTHAPYTLTVVDNGSDADLRKELSALHKNNIIHNLYFLDDNYGVSCACNVGWKLHESSVYMKLDNDIIALEDAWLNNILLMWGKNRYRTLFGPIWNGDCPQCRHETARGVYWSLPISLSGPAFLVSRKVVEAIGFFSEDYGLYGEEDADYCLRCHHAGIRKYTYEAAGLIRHDGVNNAEYIEKGVDKSALHNKNVGAGAGANRGIFALNLFLYENGLKSLNVPLKYEVENISGHQVTVREREDYKRHSLRLSRCLEVFNNAYPDREAMKSRMAELLAGPV
jgi:GT2 family glycosyltransferase